MAKISWGIGGFWYVLFFVRLGRLVSSTNNSNTFLRNMYDTIDFAIIGSIFIVCGMILWQIGQKKSH